MDHFLSSLYWICYGIASVLCFGPEACEILAPRPGIEPAPPALEGDFLHYFLHWTTREIPRIVLLDSFPLRIFQAMRIYPVSNGI